MTRKKTRRTRKKRNKPKPWMSLRARLVALVLVAFVSAVAGAGYAVSRAVSRDLPRIAALKDYRPPPGTRILSADDRLIGRIRRDKGVFVPLSQIPDNLKKAVIAVEDARFYRHGGLDYRGILRAAVSDLVSGRLKEGGSTITQQLAKVMFLTPRKSFTRKIKEVLLARKMEQTLDKDEILELYLNKVYFGRGAYGVEMAARTYFGKHVGDLTLPEDAMLAGIIRSPARYSPYRDMKRARARRKTVLDRMAAERYISRGRAEAASEKKLVLDDIRAKRDIAPHLVEWIRVYLENRYGPEKVYLEGLTVTTTIDSRLQAAAGRALMDGVARAAGRGKAAGRGMPLQGALAAMDPMNGNVLALVGGPDFRTNEFNHALYARRQPGSAFKPFVYAAALEKGFTPADIIDDSPVSYEGWTPHNFEHRHGGAMRLREALVSSNNVVTVKLLHEVGVDRVVGLAKRLGMKGPFTRDLTLALGSCSVTPMELAAAYCAFANGGYAVRPLMIRSVADSRGKVLERNYSELRPALSPQSAYQVTDMLRDVIRRGTARRAAGLGIPAAGKTGTTNDYVDAWFVGYTPRLATCVWVGHDDRGSIGPGETGARAALPVWMQFMRTARRLYGTADFRVPGGVEFVEIDKDTGKPASWFDRNTLTECFKTSPAGRRRAAPPRRSIFDRLFGD